jgi:hypothetical protein
VVIKQPVVRLLLFGNIILSMASATTRFARLDSFRVGNPSSPCVRAIALHGKGNNGATFAARLGPLIDATSKLKSMQGEISITFTNTYIY